MGHNDLFGGTCYRHEAGGALPVDRHARDGDGQTCAQCSCAADRMLYALWQRRTEDDVVDLRRIRSEEHTSELQSLMRISYAVFCLKKKKHNMTLTNNHLHITKELAPSDITTHVSHSQ